MKSSYAILHTASLQVGALIVALLACPALVTAQTRVDLFDAKWKRTGGVIIHERTGRVDIYDRDANRVGYGQIDRTSGRVDLYDTRGNRIGSSVVNPNGRSIREPR